MKEELEKELGMLLQLQDTCEKEIRHIDRERGKLAQKLIETIGAIQTLQKLLNRTPRPQDAAGQSAKLRE